MYKRIKKAKLGRKETHRNSLRRNLLRSLFEKNYVVTTSPKAKVLKSDASSLLEKGKMNKDKVTFIRDLQVILGDDKLIKKLKDYLTKEKVGVIITKVGFRSGDNAEKSRVTLLGMEKKKKIVKKDDEKDGNKKVEKHEPKRRSVFGQEKKVDTTVTIKKTERARTRAGL